MIHPLKPCPFGCKTAPVFKHSKESPFITSYWVECPTCGIVVGKCGIPAKAVDTWNHRVDSVNQELLTALKNILKSPIIMEARKLVAGWNGSGEKKSPPHPFELGYTLRTVCSEVYALGAYAENAQRAIESAEKNTEAHQ